MVLSVEHHDGGVALVRLDDAAARNAFDIPAMQRISDTLNGLMDDAEVRAIVLTGSGRFFCAGADIEDFASAIDDGSIGDLVQGLTGILHPLQIRLRTDPTVYIAAMNGAAAGGGLGLALAADCRIACPDTRMAAAFFRLGLSPDGGTTWLLPRLVGAQVARRFFFEDEVWKAEEALEKGAVDEIVDTDDLVDRALDVARRWGRWAGLSRSSTKQLIDAQSSTFFQTQLDFERALITAASLTPDFAEGVSAFLEKRDPEFD